MKFGRMFAELVFLVMMLVRPRGLNLVSKLAGRSKVLFAIRLRRAPGNGDGAHQGRDTLHFWDVSRGSAGHATEPEARSPCYRGGTGASPFGDILLLNPDCVFIPCTTMLQLKGDNLTFVGHRRVIFGPDPDPATFQFSDL